MRNTRSDEILSEAFSARIEIVEALRACTTLADHDGQRLRSASDRLRAASELFGPASNAAAYSAFVDVSDLVALLIEWRFALLNAGIDAQRFLTAAKARSAAWLAAHAISPCQNDLADIVHQIASVQSVAEVPPLAAKLGSLALPIGIHAQPHRDLLRHEIPTKADPASPRSEELAVAFVKFSIDGKPLTEVHYVSPGEAHDIDLEVRVSRWPKDARVLILEPVTVEPTGTYSLPRFVLEAPLGEVGPFRLASKGRFLLTVPNHVHARPFEFKYAARFDPSESEQPVEVVGQRTLRLEGVDVARNPLTGYAAIDHRLIEIRNTLRSTPHVAQSELSDALVVAIALGNYAGQVVQDGLFKTAISEAEFQQSVRAFLRGKPLIGSDLEEHPHSAGGITDLSFRGISIELKSEAKQLLAFADCSRFVGQAASYAVGRGKHLGILCVLDCSEKNQPPFPAENGIGVFPVQHDNGSLVYIITILLQGNLAKPSALSR